MEEQNNRNSSGLPVAKIGAVIIFILVIIFVLNYFKIISLKDIFHIGKQISELNFSTTQNTPTAVIVKVGQENIYQKDLDSEMQNFPSLKNVDRRKLLLDKMIKDSIILQGARADGIVKLDSSIFNSLQKDYYKRMDLISAIREKMDTKGDILKGAMVSLWFYNRAPGKAGYDKGREIARDTITKLHDDVVSKRLTIQQAGQAIRNDPNLGNVDAAYLSNALLEFSKKPTDSVVFDAGFDAIIKRLKVDEVSDVYLAESKQWEAGKPTDKMIDSVYMFAQVTEKKKTSIAGFDDWYGKKVKAYAVTFY